MRTFVRITLVVAAALAMCAVLVVLVKLLVVAAVIAGVALAAGWLLRRLARRGERYRLSANRPARVTALTARR